VTYYDDQDPCPFTQTGDHAPAYCCGWYCSFCLADLDPSDLETVA
jgi:hypothetical protein